MTALTLLKVIDVPPKVFLSGIESGQGGWPVFDGVLGSFV